MTSKCKEKYGREWSRELTKTTLAFFNANQAGAVKHIGNKGYGIAVTDIDSKLEIKAVIPTERYTDKIFIVSYDSGTYVDSFQNVQAMIDDGWAID